MLTSADELGMWRKELLQFASLGAKSLRRRQTGTETALAELKREAASRGHRLLVAMAPRAIQVVGERVDTTFESVGINPAEADR